MFTPPKGAWFALLAAGLITVGACAQEKKNTPGVWTDPADSTLPVDFKIQGEYIGEIDGGAKLGVQVIALGKGFFQAVLLPGGLPGEGWDGKEKIFLDGKLDGEKAAFAVPADPKKKKYLANSAEEFLADSKKPEKFREFTATADGALFSGKTDDGKAFTTKKTKRESKSLGAKAPEGAVTLFGGDGKDEWNGGRLDMKTKFLNTDGSDMMTKKKFNNYTLHIEFMLPFRPEARGQGRGNSGCYQVQHYEVQVLDSFGLAGKNNECGGVYTKAEPKVNMCYPPLTWQTYDIEFTNAVVENDKKVKNARLTLKHNGVVIHDDIEISGPTGGHRNDKEGTPGPLLLQGHGNPLQYRNIWIVEKR